MAESNLRALLSQTAPYTSDEATRLRTQVIPSGEFGRGVAAHEVESEAGDLYSQSLDAELNQDLGSASLLRAKAAKTMSYAPRLKTRDEDFGGYAAGVLGAMAPELPKFAAAGLLGRGAGSLLRASRAGEHAGAAIPGYDLSRRAAITAQEQDPGVMARPAEERAAAATREGLVGGALGAIPVSHALQSATRPGLRGLFAGAGTTAAEQAAVNAGLAAYGQRELSGLNPARDTSGDTEALKEAAIAGAIGGAGMHAGFAVPGLPLRALENVAEGARRVPDVARTAVEAATPAAETARDAGASAVDALRDRFGPTAETAFTKGRDALQRGVTAVQGAAERVPEAIRSAESPSDFLSQVFPKLRKPPETADEMFPATLEDELGTPPATPAAVAGKSARQIYEDLKQNAGRGAEQARDYYQRAAERLGGDYNPATPEGQRRIVNALQARANDFGKKLDDFASSFKKPEGEKSSYMTSKARPALENTVFDHLSDAARSDPAVIEKLPELTDALSQFMARSGSLGKDDVAAITNYKRLEGLFKNPDALEKDLGKTLQLDAKELSKIRSISSAAEDATNPNSFLYLNLPEDARGMKSGQLRQVGDLVDRLRTADDETFNANLPRLSRVFGSEEKARRVLDFYSNDFKNKVGVDVPDRVLGLGTAKTRETHVPENFDRGESEYIFKDHASSRPFFAGEDTSRHANAARAEGLNVRASNYLDFVHEHGLDTSAEAQRLIADAERRLTEIKTKGQGATGEQRVELAARYKRLKPQVDLMQRVLKSDKPVMVEGHGRVVPGEEGVLELHTVLSSEKKEGESRMDASRDELGKYGAPKDAAESIKSTLVNAKLKDPVSGTVKPRTFSLESMARHELRANPSEYENFATYNEKLRAAATRGLAKIAARPDFQGFEKSARGNELRDLVVHRASNTRLDLTKRETKPGTTWTPEQVEELTQGKEKLSALIDKYKGADRTSRKELQTRVEQRAEALRQEATGVGPAAAFAKRKAEHLDAALKKMQGVRTNEAREQAETKLRNELQLTDRKEPDVLENEITSLRAAEAESLRAMRKLTEGMKSQQNVAPKEMREFVPANKRDQFEFENARYYAARKLASEKEAALSEQARDLEGQETVEAHIDRARTEEDRAVRKFRDDFEMYGREDTKGRLKPPKNPSGAKDGASGEKASNYVAQGAGPTIPLDPAAKQRIQDEFLKTVGPHVELRFEQALGGKAGSYTPKAEHTKAIVRAVIASTAETQGTVWHESMHHLFRTMGDNARSDAARRAYRDLKQVAQSPFVQQQLRKLLEAYPKAIDQLSDVDESLAYLYQFWRKGQEDGQTYVQLNPTGIKWFEKIRDFIYNALGVVSKTQKVEEIFSAFQDGQFADESLIDAALRDLRAKTVRDRLDHLAPGVGKAFDALILGATDRLRSYGYNSLDQIADLFHKEPDRESGKLGFLQRRQQVQGIELNRFQDALGSPTKTEVEQALQHLQAMQAPRTPLEKTLRSTLDRLFGYMDRAGVKMKNSDGKWVPVSQHYVQNYFPRVWDKRAIDGNRAEFAKLLMQEGKMPRSRADEVVSAILGGDGLIDLAENEHHLGFTPANQALSRRALDFITPANAAKFVKFQSRDLNEIMSKYIYQAVHRAEYARSFGNDGEMIQEAFRQAKTEGMSDADIASARRAVMAMEGTLGHDFNPTLRKLFTAATAYENVVLLPFALLSSFSDVAGVSLRSNEFKDQFRAMQLGIQGITKQLTRADESNDKLLARAKEFGIVDSLNMLENYGNIYNSSFMAPTLRKINDKFFRWNGMEMWNRQMRLAGFEAAQRFVLRNLKDRRYMDELGLKQSDLAHIKATADGGIDFDTLPAPTYARMQAAMFRFVDGAVLRPNAAQRPVWASDPAWMLIAHLKQFAFSFQNTFIRRYANELGHGNTKSGLLFLSFLPFGIFSGAVRRSLAGQGAFTGLSVGAIINDGSMRSGMYGTGMFLEDAIGDVQRGKLPGTSFLGPTAEHAQRALEFATGGPESGRALLLRSTPLSPLVKDFSPAPD